MTPNKFKILKKTRFTVPMLNRIMRLSDSGIRKHVKQLEEGGYITRIPDLFPVEYCTTHAGHTVKELIELIKNENRKQYYRK